MKAKQVLGPICAKCGDNIKGMGTPKFFMPVPNRTSGTNPSKQVCRNCFSEFLESNQPDPVTVTATPTIDDEFYGGEPDPADYDDGESTNDPVPVPAEPCQHRGRTVPGKYGRRHCMSCGERVE